MSRTRKHQETQDIKIAYGAGFEVGASVCGCYLKKIAIKDKMFGEIPYHMVYLHFIKNNKWVTKFIPDKPREAFESDEEHQRSKLEVMSSLENLVACYLTNSHIKHIFFQTQTFGIKGLIKEIEKALTEKKFWDVEICLKTIPEKDGGVNIARFSPFMNKTRNSSWKLQYTKWELPKVTEWYSKNK